MSETTVKPWWEMIPEGQPVLLAFIKVDRKGSTEEWRNLPAEEVHRRRDAFVHGVEYVARSSGAAELHWQGDGVMLFLRDEESSPAIVRAFAAARLIWERIRVDLNLPARIAVHAALVPWKRDTGQLADSAIDLCGHLEQAAPVNSIVVSEDVYLCLPEKDRGLLGPLGVTARDGAPAYVFPPSAAETRAADAFLSADDLALWEAFRGYVGSPEISRLRYVGFRLARKEPPSLDIRDVFVPLEVEARRGRWDGALAELARREGRHAARQVAPAGGPPGQGEAEEMPFACLREGAERAMPARFEDVFRGSRSLVILGEPGSGKSTLLRWLAVLAAGGRLGLGKAIGLYERLLPLPVSVGLLAEVRRQTRDRDGAEPSVPAALARYFHARSVGPDENTVEGFLQGCLGRGQCLVLLDGLDEVAGDDRQAVRAWLESFAHAYPANRFVATSRTVGYGGFGLPGGAEITLRPFGDAQVERYVRGFCRAYRRWEMGFDDVAGGDRAAEDLLRALRALPRLHALARNPFLLSGLALIHRSEGRLPRHRVQFYEVFARALCETWTSARRLVAGESMRVLLFEEEAVPVLGELAERIYAEHPTGMAPTEFVEEELAGILSARRGADRAEGLRAARDFLCRCGQEVQIFLERGAGRWGFLHLTFLEFFVAAGLHAAERFEDEAWKHLHDGRWEEIIRLGVGYLAICQKRPTAAARFVERVFRDGGGTDQPEIAQALRRHIPMAALLAAEAGDALPADLQRQIAEAFAEWHQPPGTALGQRILADVGLTDLAEPMAQPYLPLMKSEDVGERAWAARHLGLLRTPAALEALRIALKDDHWWVRRSATEGLGRLGGALAVEVLRVALDHEDQEVRRLAAEGLARLGDAAGIEGLRAALKNRDSETRNLAAAALGLLADAGAVEGLRAALLDPDWPVRASAALALGQIGDPASGPDLRAALRDGPETVRIGAAEALSRLNDPAGAQALCDFLRSDSAWSRVLAAGALGRIRATTASEAVRAALEDHQEMVRYAAAASLGMLGDASAAVALRPLLRDDSAAVRAFSAQALGSLGDAGAAEGLEALLQDAKEVVRAFAAEALGQIGDVGATGALIAALSDAEDYVRARAADALESLLARQLGAKSPPIGGGS